MMCNLAACFVFVCSVKYSIHNQFKFDLAGEEASVFGAQRNFIKWWAISLMRIKPTTHIPMDNTSLPLSRSLALSQAHALTHTYFISQMNTIVGIIII